MPGRDTPDSKARLTGAVAFWALAGAALFVAHDAILVVQAGPGEAVVRTLRGAGHEYWGIASAGLALTGLMVAIGALLRYRRLWRTATSLGVPTAAIEKRTYAVRVLRSWARLATVVAIGFAVQENVEHLVSHDHLLGLGALIEPEYPLALPVIATITLVAGLVAAGYVAAERRLVAGIHDALRRLERPPRRLARAPLRLHVRRSSPLAFAVAGRGPPLRLLDVLS